MRVKEKESRAWFIHTQSVHIPQRHLHMQPWSDTVLNTQSFRRGFQRRLKTQLSTEWQLEVRDLLSTGPPHTYAIWLRIDMVDSQQHVVLDWQKFADRYRPLGLIPYFAYSISRPRGGLFLKLDRVKKGVRKLSDMCTWRKYDHHLQLVNLEERKTIASIYLLL